MKKYFYLFILYIVVQYIGYRIIYLIKNVQSKYNYLDWTYYFYNHENSIIFYYYLFFIFTTSISFLLIFFYILSLKQKSKGEIK